MQKKEEKKKETVQFFDSLFPKKDEEFEDHEIWWGLSTISALAGVQHYAELVGALAAHGIAWYMEGQGPSVIYNFLTGIRIHRRQYAYAYIPAGTNVYDLTEMPTESNVAHAAALAAGYLMSSNKIV